MLKRAKLISILCFSVLCLKAQSYDQLKENISSGWNTWNNRNMLSFVHLPDGLSINIHYKKNTRSHEHWLHEAVVERVKGGANVTPGFHAYNGSYTEMGLNYRWYGDSEFKIESAHDGDDLVILVTLLNEEPHPPSVVAEVGYLWYKEGNVTHNGSYISAEGPGGKISIYPTGQTYKEYNTSLTSPILALKPSKFNGFSTGKERSISEIQYIIQRERDNYIEKYDKYGEYSALAKALHSNLAWNTAYDPHKSRVLTTVSREWSRGGGGYMIFGWDNFLYSYVIAKENKELAMENMLAVFEEMVDGEFVPNNSYGSGLRTLDRSQPPVGSTLIYKVYELYPEQWFLEAAFEPLLKWNRWWLKSRMNQGLLSYGSNAAPNPHNSNWHFNLGGAKMESGLDNSPMYDSAVFNPVKQIMELQDVGLNSLYISDCENLAKIARILGKKAEQKELLKRAGEFKKRLAKLWDEREGIYLNYDTEKNVLSKSLSPTLFYPMLVNLPSEKQVTEMVERHLLDTAEFGLEYMLPSSPKNDPAFSYHRYWRGSVWPPLNFFVYYGLKNYRSGQKAAEILAERSYKLLMTEWERRKAIGENYSAIDGTVDADHVKSHPYYSWGTLLGILILDEKSR